jgi:hypothetical protein
LPRHVGPLGDRPTITAPTSKRTSFRVKRLGVIGSKPVHTGFVCSSLEHGRERPKNSKIASPVAIGARLSRYTRTTCGDPRRHRDF